MTHLLGGVTMAVGMHEVSPERYRFPPFSIPPTLTPVRVDEIFKRGGEFSAG
jgi:hypothetical protein